MHIDRIFIASSNTKDRLMLTGDQRLSISISVERSANRETPSRAAHVGSVHPGLRLRSGLVRFAATVRPARLCLRAWCSQRVECFGHRTLLRAG